MTRRRVVALLILATMPLALSALAQTAVPIRDSLDQPVLHATPETGALHLMWIGDDVGGVDAGARPIYYSTGTGFTMSEPVQMFGYLITEEGLRVIKHVDGPPCGFYIRRDTEPLSQGVLDNCWYGNGSDGGYQLYQENVEDFDLIVSGQNQQWMLYLLDGQAIMREPETRFAGTPVSPEGVLVTTPEVVVDSLDGRHAFWSIERRGWYASYSIGDEWSEPATLSELPPALHGRRTRGDASGRVHSAILTEEGFEYTWWESGTWSAPLILPLEVTVHHSAMTVDPGGTAVVVLATDDGAVVYLVDPETGWENWGVVPGTEGRAVDHLDIAYTDRAWVLWHEAGVVGYTLTPLSDEDPPEDPQPGTTTTLPGAGTTQPGPGTTLPGPGPTQPPGDGPGEAVDEVPGVEVQRPLTVRAVPSVQDISLEPVVLAISAVLALAIILIMPFPGELFNNVFTDHYDEIRGWFPWLRGKERRDDRGFWDTRPGLVVFLLVAALLYGFLEPGFGLNSRSAPVLVGLFLAMVLVAVGFFLPNMVMRRKTTGESGRFRVLPLALVVGLVCVLVSRLTGFLPGYLYAMVIVLVFVKEIGEDEEAREMTVASVVLLLGGVVAWILLGVSRSGGGTGFGSVVLEAVLAFLTIAVFETLAIGLMPLRGLPGRAMMRGDRVAWLVLWGLSVFLFFHVVINPANGYLTSSAFVPLITTITLLATFTLISVWLWWHFNRRTRP